MPRLNGHGRSKVVGFCLLGAYVAFRTSTQTVLGSQHLAHTGVDFGCLDIHIYIYIWRERERDLDIARTVNMDMRVCLCIHIHIYIYIYLCTYINLYIFRLYMRVSPPLQLGSHQFLLCRRMLCLAVIASTAFRSLGLSQVSAPVCHSQTA